MKWGKRSQKANNQFVTLVNQIERCCSQTEKAVVNLLKRSQNTEFTPRAQSQLIQEVTTYLRTSKALQVLCVSFKDKAHDCKTRKEPGRNGRLPGTKPLKTEKNRKGFPHL